MLAMKPSPNEVPGATWQTKKAGRGAALQCDGCGILALQQGLHIFGAQEGGCPSRALSTMRYSPLNRAGPVDSPAYEMRLAMPASPQHNTRLLWRKPGVCRAIN